MYIGHFAPAAVLVQAAPSVPTWVSLVGVSFPDLFWGLLVVAGFEKLKIDPDSPLQKNIKFTHYPFSHSLLLTNIIACIPAAIIVYFYGYIAGLVFLLASISHWGLDAIVHLRDLPVLGFNGDRKVGLGLWKYGWLSFVIEYLLLVVGTVLIMPFGTWTQTLAGGSVLHAANANSFFGFTRKNPIRTSKQYALLVFFAFIVAIIVFEWAFGSFWVR